MPGTLAFGNQPVSTSSARPDSDCHEQRQREPAHWRSRRSAGRQTPLQFTCQRQLPERLAARARRPVHDDGRVHPHDAGRHERDDPGELRRQQRPNTVSLTGTGTPSAVGFTPGPGRCSSVPTTPGTFSTPKTVTLTNRTSGLLTISKVYLGGPNPNSFRITGGNCAGQALAADASCTETVRFAPNEVGVKAANLTAVNDNGAGGQHLVAAQRHRDLSQGRRGPCAARPAATRRRSRGSRAGTSSRFDRTVIVRSRTHIPTGPSDGPRLPARRRRPARPRPAATSRPTSTACSRCIARTPGRGRSTTPAAWSLRLRTGEICTPMDGGVISDTTPTVSWLGHATIFGYSFLLFHGNDQVQQPRFVHATSFTLQRPPAPAPRLHLHALPLRLSARPSGGHVDRAHHVPRPLGSRRPVAERGRGEEDDLGGRARRRRTRGGRARCAGRGRPSRTRAGTRPGRSGPTTAAPPESSGIAKMPPTKSMSSHRVGANTSRRRIGHEQRQIGDDRHADDRGRRRRACGRSRRNWSARLTGGIDGCPPHRRWACTIAERVADGVVEPRGMGRERRQRGGGERDRPEGAAPPRPQRERRDEREAGDAREAGGERERHGAPCRGAGRRGRRATSRAPGRGPRSRPWRARTRTARARGRGCRGGRGPRSGGRGRGRTSRTARRGARGSRSRRAATASPTRTTSRARPDRRPGRGGRTPRPCPGGSRCARCFR